MIGGIADRSAPLEEWIVENELDNLKGDVETHVEVLSNLDSEEEKDTLVRMIMISVRQAIEERENG